MNFSFLKKQAKNLKRYTLTVYFVAKDPTTPRFVKLLAILVAAYALSPIDLIPDFIPIIGYIDDLIIVPLGLALVLRLTPQHIIDAAQQKAQHSAEKPVSYIAASIFISIWVISLSLFSVWLYRVFYP